jgi:hypothetical protein
MVTIRGGDTSWPGKNSVLLQPEIAIGLRRAGEAVVTLVLEPFRSFIARINPVSLLSRLKWSNSRSEGTLIDNACSSPSLRTSEAPAGKLARVIRGYTRTHYSLSITF